MDVARIREAMLQEVKIPAELINESLRATREALDAKETKFFTYKGVITAQHEVIDHVARLRAADQAYNIADMYAKDRDQKETPSVALEVDSVTGVVRLVVGGGALDSSPTSPALTQAAAPVSIPIPALKAAVPFETIEIPEDDETEEDYVVFSKIPAKQLDPLYKDLLG
jgi:hypothetical protein